MRKTEDWKVNLARLFFESRGPAVSLTAKELAVLDSVRALETPTCCSELQRKLRQDCGQEPRLATLYSVLIELERKGLLKTVDSVTPENGGRPSRRYKITAVGENAIDLGATIVAHLRLEDAAQPA
jgi:DNA-binding PadR family transcriptional regulator